jgi:hypothetical protein
MDTRRRSEALGLILICGVGRSGTTALMSALASSPDIAFQRAYPYEHRYLTYMASLAVYLARPHLGHFSVEDLDIVTFPDRFVPVHWNGGHLNAGLFEDWFPALWSVASRHWALGPARAYAEKANPWLSPLLRRYWPSHSAIHSVYLFRDPRDIYGSAMAFMKRMGHVAFARRETDTDLDYAVRLCAGCLDLYMTYKDELLADSGTIACIRYEDFVNSGPSTFCQAITSRTGAEFDIAAIPNHLTEHKTSPSLEESIGRYRSDSLSHPVLSAVEVVLEEPMRALGYILETEPTRREMRIHGKSSIAIASTDGEIEFGPSDATVTLSGEDFWIVLADSEVAAADFPYALLSVSGGTGTHCSLYWRHAGEEFSEERCLHINYTPMPNWTSLVFALVHHSLWCGIIAQLRVDLFNGPVSPNQPGRVRSLTMLTIS